MAEHIRTTEHTPATLDERVERLRTQLCSTPHGSKLMVDITPAGMVHTNGNIIDFCDWGQSWTQSR